MSTFELLHKEEKSVYDFIKNNKRVSAYGLKKEFKSVEIQQELCEIVDNLLFEKRIITVYEEESPVFLYVVV